MLVLSLPPLVSTRANMSDGLCVVGSWFGECRWGDCGRLRPWLVLSEVSLSRSLSPQALLKDIQAGSTTLTADFQPLCCSVQTSPLFTACGHCYVIKTWVLMAIMIADIILTLLITVSVFCLVTKLKRRRDPDSERCLPLPVGSILLHTQMKMGFYLSR